MLITRSEGPQMNGIRQPRPSPTESNRHDYKFTFFVQKEYWSGDGGCAQQTIKVQVNILLNLCMDGMVGCSV